MSAFETIEARLELSNSQFLSSIDDSVSSLGNLGDTAGNVSKKVGALGAVAAGSAAAALGSAASKAIDFEAAMADVEKVTDPQTAAEMSDEILEMSKRIPLAQEELAGLATQAGRMGAEGTEEVAAFTETAGAMASATVMSADEAGTALGKMSSALGEPLKEVQRLGDSVNEVSNSFQTDSAEIVDATQRAGQGLRELGMGSEEIIGLAGAFNEVSPSSELAAQKMQQVSEAMMDPENVGLFADALGVTSDEFVNMRNDSPEETMLSLMDTVDEGKLSWEDLSEHLSSQQARAFRDSAESADRMRKAMDLSNQAAQEGESVANELATETGTLSGQMELFRNRLNNVAIQIGENLTPYLRGLMEMLNGAFSVIEDASEATDGWAVTIGALATIVIGSAMAIGAFTSATTLAATASAAATGAVAGLGTAFTILTGPIGLVAAALLGLGIAYRENLFGFQDAVNSVVNAVMPYLERVADFLRERLPPTLNQLQADAERAFTAFQAVVGRFVEFARPYLESLFSWLSGVYTTYVQPLEKEFTETWEVWREQISRFVEWMRPYVTGFFEWYSGFVQSYLGVLKSLWDRFGDDIITVGKHIFTTIRLVVEQFVDAITTFFKVGLNVLQGDWEGALDAIRGYGERTFGRISELVGSWVDTFIGLVDTAVTAVVDLFSWLYERLVGNSIVPDMVSEIISSIKGLYDDFTSWIDDTVLDAKDALKGLLDWIRDKFDIAGTLKGVFTDAGEAASSAFQDAFNASVGGSTLSIPEISQDIPDWVPEYGGKSFAIGGQSLNIPELNTGGVIQEDGIAMVHKGEHIYNPAKANTGNPTPPEPSSGGGDTIIDFGGIPDDAWVRMGDIKEAVKKDLDREAKIAINTKPGT